jgi:dinuclear metal center YbgI/SA1388 family protein
MKLKNIYNILNEISPFELQEEWDNSGLLVGKFDDEVKKIYVSLDIDSQVVENLEPNSLVITHHPLIFKGLKKLNFSSYPSNIIQKLIQKNISLVSMHTNFDKTHLNKYVVSEVLGFEVKEVVDFVCYFDVNDSFLNFQNLIKDKLNLKSLTTVAPNDFVKTCAITTGSGASLLPYIKADCFLTGDIKYHEALEAKENNINLIDIKHYESELFFAQCLQDVLKNYELSSIICDFKNPFS